MKIFLLSLLIIIVFVSGCTQTENNISDSNNSQKNQVKDIAKKNDTTNECKQIGKECCVEDSCLGSDYACPGQVDEDILGCNEQCYPIIECKKSTNTNIGYNPNNNCQDEPIKFDHVPADMDKVSYIIPMGSVHGDHVSPTDHQYYISKENEEVDVYSPGDGRITGIQHMGSFMADRFVMDDYRITIQHNCKMSSVFIHIDELSEKLAAVAPADGEYVSVDVPVEANEILGTYNGGLDYNVVDETVSINLINPESYDDAYEHRVHITDPFNYFNEPVKSQLIAKSLRSEEPLGGTIDYDVDGTLAGVWFQEGTGGWSGNVDGNTKYWSGHLAIVYHHVDPEHVIVSFGTYDDPENQGRQLAVKGSEPDPAKVTPDTGLVKYELVDYKYYDNDENWDLVSFPENLDVKNDDNVNDVVLFQLLDDTTLKMELFIGKSGSQVNEFTSEALIYKR